MLIFTALLQLDLQVSMLEGRVARRVLTSAYISYLLNGQGHLYLPWGLRARFRLLHLPP